MTGKPESDPQVTVGPNTRVTFMGVTLIGLLAGLCVGSWVAATAFEKLNRNIEDRVTQDQLFYWTLDARVQVPQLPIYPPPKRN